jgi:ankyrin repeat protein
VRAAELAGKLCSAARAGRVERARELLDAGAPVDGRAPDGSAPLHRAAREAHAGLVELLLARGADPAIADAAGWTPLHHVAGGPDRGTEGEASRERIVALLLARGAPLGGPPGGATPLEVARRFGRARIEEALRVAGPPAV